MFAGQVILGSTASIVTAASARSKQLSPAAGTSSAYTLIVPVGVKVYDAPLNNNVPPVKASYHSIVLAGLIGVAVTVTGSPKQNPTTPVASGDGRSKACVPSLLLFEEPCVALKPNPLFAKAVHSKHSFAPP